MAKNLYYAHLHYGDMAVRPIERADAPQIELMPAEWLQPGAVIPITAETVQTLLNALRRLTN
jgi:hypothetical protein